MIVMGGPMGVYEHSKYPFLLDELRLIEAALKTQLPVIGICLGSQFLAATLGVNVRPGSRQEIGWYPVHLELAAPADTLFTDAPTRFEGFHWHGDIFDLPDGAIRLARTPKSCCQPEPWHGISGHQQHDQRGSAVRDLLVRRRPCSQPQLLRSFQRVDSGLAVLWLSDFQHRTPGVAECKRYGARPEHQYGWHTHGRSVRDI